MTHKESIENRDVISGDVITWIKWGVEGGVWWVLPMVFEVLSLNSEDRHKCQVHYQRCMQSQGLLQENGRTRQESTTKFEWRIAWYTPGRATKRSCPKQGECKDPPKIVFWTPLPPYTPQKTWTHKLSSFPTSYLLEMPWKSFLSVPM